MNLRKVVIISCFALTIVSFTYADITSDDIAGALKKDLTHPYLYFDEEDKPAILERIKNDPYCHDIMEHLLAGANRYLYTPVDPAAPDSMYRSRTPFYDFSGGGGAYPRFLINFSRAAVELAFVYQMTGEIKYAQKAYEFVDVVCDQPTWIHDNLFCGYRGGPPLIYNRLWPYGVTDDRVVFNYDHFQNHVVKNVAAVYDWLYPALSIRLRDRIRGKLLENAILRVRGNYDYHWWAAAYRCNWCAACNGGLGIASIALLTEDPQLSDVIAESYNRVGKTLDQIRDGGWQEGISYMNGTVRPALEFADVLKRVTDGKYNLYKHPCIDDAVKTFLYCQISPDRMVHFGDCGGGNYVSYNMFNQIMIETGNRQAAWLVKHRTGGNPGSLFDLFNLKSILEPELPRETSIHFHAVDWIIMRNDFNNPEHVVIAGKSGKNDDGHHGHLDVGHFSLYWRGLEFICDQGHGGEDTSYFTEKRWENPLASSLGHNVVFVNGEEQIAGKVPGKPIDETIGGRIVEFRPGKDRDYALMDPTHAYPCDELKGWRRHIILEKPVITIVLDEITSKQGAEIEARFHSPVDQVDQIIMNDYVLLKSSNGSMALIPVIEGDYALKAGKHLHVSTTKKARTRTAPYVGVITKALNEQTVLGTIIVPVYNESEAEKIVKSVKRKKDKSGNLTVSFIKAGKTYSYRYKKRASVDLVLE